MLPPEETVPDEMMTVAMMRLLDRGGAGQIDEKRYKIALLPEKNKGRNANLSNVFYGKSYFWRTQQQQEIDYLEDVDGVLHAYEFKWNPERKARLTGTFAKNYPDHTFCVIHPDNYQEFVL